RMTAVRNSRTRDAARERKAAARAAASDAPASNRRGSATQLRLEREVGGFPVQGVVAVVVLEGEDPAAALVRIDRQRQQVVVAVVESELETLQRVHRGGRSRTIQVAAATGKRAFGLHQV